uniref:Uncharacterized protein n=1 Tax=Tanacetum cinerariifolium TaxID=118510 RepID=A0A6L2M514_TANCI|nr:hypothetical protein [Tanacetum cinerariifolium]
MSRNYTLDENTYPQFLCDDDEEMDLLSFIRTADPTKVRIGERQRGELEASVDKLFDKGGNGKQAKQGHSASSWQGAGVYPISEAEEVVTEDVVPLQPRSQKKKKTIVAGAGEPSHPLKKLKEDHGTLSGASIGGKSRSAIQRLLAGATLNTKVRGGLIPTLLFAPQRFVISLDYSHHSGANIAEAEVDSFSRPSASVITASTAVTLTVDPAVVTKEKIIEPSLLSDGSASAGGTDPAMGCFADLYGNDFLVGGIRTVINPNMDLQKMSLSAKVSMRAEYNIKEKRRLEYVVEEKNQLLKSGDKEIKNLKAQLLLKEAKDITVQSKGITSNSCEKNPQTMLVVIRTEKAPQVPVNYLVENWDLVSPPYFAAKRKKGRSQTVISTSPKSQGPEASGSLSKKSKIPLSKSHPLRPRGNKQPLDKDITFMTPDEGKTKTMPHPKGSRRDKDSGGNKPPTDMEPQNPTDTNLSRTGAKYKEDQTQSFRLRITNDQWEKHEEAAIHYVNLRAFIDDYYNENITYRDQTDILVEASMSSLEKSNSTINDLYKGLEVITKLLKDITHYVKDDPAINKKSTVKNIQHHAFKQEEALTAWMKSSTNMAWNLGFRILSLKNPKPTFTQACLILKKIQDPSRGECYTILSLKNLLLILSGTNANIQEKPKEPKQSTDANIREGKGIATDDQAKDKRKLVKASSIVYPDEPDKVEDIKKAKEEAKLDAISKNEVIKIVQEEAMKLGINLKEAIATKAGKLFRKLRMLNMRSLKYNTLRRSKLDELREIIPKKKNIVVKDLMKSLSQRYEKLRKIPGELGVQPALPLLKQASSQTSGRKQKYIELDPKIRIPGLECNLTLFENASFVNNMVIKEPNYGIFFTGEFGDQAFEME